VKKCLKIRRKQAVDGKQANNCVANRSFGKGALGVAYEILPMALSLPNKIMALFLYM